METPEGHRDPKERELERLRVLEAAGLLVRDDTPVKRRPRRAAPARPERLTKPDVFPTTELEMDEETQADEPEEQEQQEERMEDAFDVSDSFLSDRGADRSLPSALSTSYA